MPKNARSKQSRGTGSVRAGDDDSSEARLASAFKPPLTPSRRRLFIAAGLLAVWVGLLLTLYVTAVFPAKQKKAVKTPEPQPATGTVSR